MDGKDNPADICSKHTSSREWYEVMKPLIFWRAKDGALGSHCKEESVRLPGNCTGKNVLLKVVSSTFPPVYRN